MNLAARIFSQQLDRSKPLWELWLVEGLADGGFALLSKTHHAMIDGIAGVDLGTVLFDLGPEGRPPEEGLEPWMPDPAPSPLDLLAAGVAGMTKASLGVAAKALGSLSRPERALEDAKVAAEGLGEIVWAAREPGAAVAAERRDRPAPALRRRRLRAARTSRPSRTRSAARSTTSC